MIIIDASVVNKLFLPNEVGRENALTILKKHIQKKDKIIVPDLLFYEVANTLATKTAIPPGQVAKSLSKLDKMDLIIFHPTLEDIGKAAIFAKKYGVSVYDAVYAVIAAEEKCNLVTADERFIAKTNLDYILNLNYLPTEK
ncbi:MAG: type II toxin-antitoxin system VapC family toxin [Candidatus Levybacteria bacterium]|nr:type II toxin-antitoxin system VapC family toxin [Candidatus Levybacteria bacterium]